MQVFRGVPERADRSTVLTIGNFDGVHRGHVELLRRLVEAARRLGLPAAVMTFEPHPREFFAPAFAPARLSSLREKLELLSTHGVDRVYVCRFNARFATLTAQDFIERILVQGLSVRHLIVGDDFRFGQGRSGDFALLEAAGGTHGFKLEATPTVDFRGERVSSSAVRDALTDGDLPRAALLLGRAYSLSGRVVHGDKIGRTLGFATANIGLKGRKPPLSGIYAVTLDGVAGKSLPGAASVGVRPTVTDTARPTLEVHLLDFDANIYGHHVRVNFLARLRDEEKYTSLEALKHAIGRDVIETRRYFGCAVESAPPSTQL